MYDVVEKRMSCGPATGMRMHTHSYMQAHTQCNRSRYSQVYDVVEKAGELWAYRPKAPLPTDVLKQLYEQYAGTPDRK